MGVAHRFARTGTALYAGLTHEVNGKPVWTGRIVVNERVVDAPLRWRRPRRIFVNSMSDLFHEDVADETIDRIFAVMALAPRHTFQILTKRPERMHEYMSARVVNAGNEPRIAAFAGAVSKMADARGLPERSLQWPLANMWLGVSVEDQRRADERIPLLLQTPVALRFLSMEPLLGPVDIRNYLSETGGVDWVIVGGESGPEARPMHLDWARALRDQCLGARVPFFFKQWGEWAPDTLATGAFWDTVLRHEWPDETLPNGKMAQISLRAGKKRAGRTLDGRSWDEMPPHLAALPACMVSA